MKSIAGNDGNINIANVDPPLIPNKQKKIEGHEDEKPRDGYSDEDLLHKKRNEQKVVYPSGGTTMEKIVRNQLASTSGPTTNRTQLEIANMETQIGISIVKKMDEVSSRKSATTGVWFEHTYINEHSSHWNKKYIGGHAPDEFTKSGPMDWQLKPGQSASEAIQKWLTGLTIAECGSTLVAICLDTLRQQLGNVKFDAHFGSASRASPILHYLRVSSDHSDCIPEKLLKGAGTNDLGKQTLVLGAKYYFKNHDSYLYRHPAGPSRGENVIYMGDDPEKGPTWSGLAVKHLSTPEMFDTLLEAYNVERTEEDYEAILLNSTTRIDKDFVLSEKAKGHSYKSLYNAWKKHVHPFFIAAEQTLDLTILKAENDAEIDGQGIMLNTQEVAKLLND